MSKKVYIALTTINRYESNELSTNELLTPKAMEYQVSSNIILVNINF